jgi:hypothetical protein
MLVNVAPGKHGAIRAKSVNVAHATSIGAFTSNELLISMAAPLDKSSYLRI